MPDYIPPKDSDFNNWVKILCPYAHTEMASLGISVPQDAALQAALASWSIDYPALLSAQNTADQAAQVKKTTRKDFEAIIREIVSGVQANPSVTNEQKAALGITIYKETKTPSPVPITRPMAEVDNKNRLQHTINFFDEKTPKSKAKPDGVRGCEIWEKIGGTPPADKSELVYAAMDSKTPYVNHFSGADAGKTVHYWLRWVNTRGEAGPWSETISVTISA
jgi:hypothetical protein